jgi:hypothetical protein
MGSMEQDIDGVLENLRPPSYRSTVGPGAGVVVEKNYTMGNYHYGMGFLGFLIIFILLIAFFYSFKPAWAQYKDAAGAPVGTVNPWIAIIVSIIVAILIGALIAWAVRP